MSETWVINEIPTFYYDSFTSTINFISNNENYSQFKVSDPGGVADMNPEYQAFGFGNKTIYNGDMSGWEESDFPYETNPYKTLYFQIPPTGDLLTWLQANAVKQVEPQPSTTNNIFFGTSAINKVYFGTSEVSKIYYGNTLIYEVGGEPTPSGYSGNIVSYGDNPGSVNFCSYIKFDTAPTSASDYDAYGEAYGNIIGATSYSGKTKVYAWGDNILSFIKVGNTTYNLWYDGGWYQVARGYDNPLEITLTENATITLGCGHSSGGGGGR